MVKITREPSTAASQIYDLIIVGGGIYGVMLSLEASRRGLRSLILERDDFGGATSYNSLRIVHGGLRYLQTLDLHRFFESVRERHWFLQKFPDLVKPLPCLMPLYGNGARRPLILRIALLLNDILAYNRNYKVRSDRHLSPGEVVTAEQVQRIFPLVDKQGLQGGAIWYDASMPDSQRLLISLLLWACALGGTALNYVEAQKLLKSNSSVAGVLAKDLISGQSYEYKAKVVVNAAGPWCREVAANFDRDLPELFKSSIAWNALVDRKALSDFALAVAPKKPGASTYFIRPWKGMMLAGTIHNPWSDSIKHNPLPTPTQLTDCLEDLNDAIPGLDLQQNEILRIFSGLLPVTESDSAKLAVREVIVEHAKHGGSQGLYSVSGVKFTTSRLVAEKTIKKIFPGRQLSKNNGNTTSIPPQNLQSRRGIFDYHWHPNSDNLLWKVELSEIIKEESVQHLDDLILRRTSIGDNPDRALSAAAIICELFDWDDARCQLEIAKIKEYFSQRKSQPINHSLVVVI
ncbi:MAG: FAD-dependent oxidoreductase [Symploca sp. SIO2B6]|nr:FAD-dependent oxidoreductase [Symploca sp. SIO2B6]